MSLPVGGVWPPRPHDQVLAAVAQCQAWWEGDHGLLNDAAGSAPRNRPSQFRGGIVGAVGRMFWGKPTQVEQATRKLHVPIAADLVQMSANLLFADPPTLLVSRADNDGDDGELSPEDQAAQDRLDRIMNTAQFHSSLVVAAESCAALGGVYARIVWDETITRNCWIDFVDADRAIPEFTWGRLTAVTFWTVLASSDDQTVWRHLERYEPGRIVHGLYKGTATELGRTMALADHEATADIMVDADSAVDLGTDRLAAGYIPNARPNPAWRTDPVLRHLGRSDLSPDVVELMDQLDEVWSSLARDVRLAKARLVVSEDLLDQRGPGMGTGFDTDREIYSPIGIPDGGNGMASTIQFIQPDVRVDEHLRVATELILEVLRRAGYSPISFGMDEGGSAATATEIEARSRASLQTRTAKGRLWANVLGPLGRTLLEVDSHIYPETKVVVTEDLEVQFPPAVRDTELQKGRTLQALDGARAISTEEKVRRLNPDWDSGRIDAEVAAIRAEGGMDLPDLGGMAVPDFPARKGLPEADTVEDGLVEPDDD